MSESVDETVPPRSRRDGMAIALVVWQIHPDESKVEEFMKWWCEHPLENKGGLLGEFLSAPVRSDEVDFPVHRLFSPKKGVEAWTFVNVGLWKDRQTFHEQVGRYIKDGVESFEAAPRRRMILEPQEWRLGEWKAPPQTCE